MTGIEAREAIAVRKSTPLTARDVQDLELIRQAPEYVGMSEAVTLRSLVRRGLDAARAEQMERGYEQIARDQQASRPRRQARARRRRPSWADES